MTSLFKRVAGGGGSTSDTEEVAAFSRPNVTEAVSKSVDDEKAALREKRNAADRARREREQRANACCICGC